MMQAITLGAILATTLVIQGVTIRQALQLAITSAFLHYVVQLAAQPPFTFTLWHLVVIELVGFLALATVYRVDLVASVVAAFGSLFGYAAVVFFWAVGQIYPFWTIGMTAVTATLIFHAVRAVSARRPKELSRWGRGEE